MVSGFLKKKTLLYLKNAILHQQEMNVYRSIIDVLNNQYISNQSNKKNVKSKYLPVFIYKRVGDGEVEPATSQASENSWIISQKFSFLARSLGLIEERLQGK